MIIDPLIDELNITKNNEISSVTAWENKGETRSPPEAYKDPGKPQAQPF